MDIEKENPFLAIWFYEASLLTKKPWYYYPCYRLVVLYTKYKLKQELYRILKLSVKKVERDNSYFNSILILKTDENIKSIETSDAKEEYEKFAGMFFERGKITVVKMRNSLEPRDRAESIRFRLIFFSPSRMLKKAIGKKQRV